MILKTFQRCRRQRQRLQRNDSPPAGSPVRPGRDRGDVDRQGRQGRGGPAVRQEELHRGRPAVGHQEGFEARRTCRLWTKIKF